MIKNKITPQLKARFLQEIGKTIETGKEHGFLICHDGNGSLSASKSSVGEENTINFLGIRSQCPFKIQGDFHTHASVSDMKNFIEREFPKEQVSDETVKDITKKLYEKNDTTTTMPSHGDLLGALVLKNKGRIVGTVCISSDAEPNKIECWTTKDDIDKNSYNRASVELRDSKFLRNPPHQWIKPLFEKEIINLK